MLLFNWIRNHSVGNHESTESSPFSALDSMNEKKVENAIQYFTSFHSTHLNDGEKTLIKEELLRFNLFYSAKSVSESKKVTENTESSTNIKVLISSD